MQQEQHRRGHRATPARSPATRWPGSSPGSEGDFDVLYKINDDGELCAAELTGDFYGEKNGELTYTLTLDEYGTEKDITAP